MGYTHYWNININVDKELYKAAFKVCCSFVKQHELILANGCGEKGSKPSYKDCLNLNGIGEESHENFKLWENSEKLNDEENNHFIKKDWVFNCCKTAQKKYDFVVVGCLVIFKYFLNENFEFKSDGDHSELYSGLKLAKDFLKLSDLYFDSEIKLSEYCKIKNNFEY